MSTGNQTQFGAELKLTGQESAQDVKTKLAAAKMATVELAQSFETGEIQLQEYMAATSALASVLRDLQRADKALSQARSEAAAAQAEQTAQQTAALQSERDWVRAMGESARAAREKAAAIAQSDLEHKLELESIAIQHQTEMLAHEAREIAAVEAAQDRELASLQQSIAAREAAERESAQVAGALAKEARARAGLSEAELAELASLQQSIAASNHGESQAEQLTAAMGLEENALRQAAIATGSYTVEVSAAASAQTKLNSAATTVKGGMGSLQQSIMAGSFAFQDFTSTSGDLGAKLNSISNNIPTLLVGLGGIGVAAGIAFTAGVALYRNFDSIAGFFEDRNPFPKAANDINGMKRELDEAKESLEKMEKAGTGNAAQLEKYNELREKTADLEARIANEQERQARLKKALEAPSEENEGRTKGFTEAIKGRGQQTLDTIATAYQQTLHEELEAAFRSRSIAVQTILESNKSEEQKRQAIASENRIWQDTKKRIEESDPEKMAGELMDQMLKGEEQAFHEFDLLIKGTGNLFGDLKKKMDDANPVLKKRAEEWEDAAEESAKLVADMAKKEAEARKKQIDIWAKESDEQFRAEEEARIDQAKAKKKIEDREWDAAKKQLDEAEKEIDRRNEAEARRVRLAAGKGASEAFGGQMAANPLADPQQFAAQLAAQMVLLFKGNGFGQGGAQLAAQQIAGEAGIRLTIPEIRAAQARMLGPRGVAAGGMLSVSPEDRVRTDMPAQAGVESAPWIEPRATRRPARRRRRPRQTGFNPAALARPPAAQAAQEGRQRAAIAAQDAAKAARTGSTMAKAKAAAAQQDARLAANTKATMAQVEAAKAADAQRQKSAQEAQRKTLQRGGYLPPAPPSPPPPAIALPAVQTTLQAVAITQGAVRKSLANIAKLDIDAQRLLGEASQLRKQADDQGTALNNGSKP